MCLVHVCEMPKRDREATSGRGAAKRASKKKKTKGSSGRTVNRREGELKGMDTVLTVSTVLASTTTNGAFLVLNLVAPGSGSFNRIGKKIFMKTLRLKGNITTVIEPEATTSNGYQQWVRMVVVYDKQPSGGTIPIWSDIFGYTPQDGTETSTILSNLRYDNTGRYRVLRDVMLEPKTAQVLALAAGTEDKIYHNMPFDEFIKINRETIYQGQSVPQTIADISSGALYVAFRAAYNAANIIVSSVDSTSVARLRYTD